MQSNANVLQVENIITRFNTQDGKVFAVNGISFDLKEGELLGVVGESGSVKKRDDDVAFETPADATCGDR